jgi:hypothetical protein
LSKLIWWGVFCNYIEATAFEKPTGGVVLSNRKEEDGGSAKELQRGGGRLL